MNPLFQMMPNWVRRLAFPFVSHTHIEPFTNFSYTCLASYSNHPTNYHSFLNINTPLSPQIALQFHSLLTTTGSFNQQQPHFIFSFNTLLRHYALGNFPRRALSLYKQPMFSFYFDSFTYSFLIKACANLDNRLLGIQFHARVVKLGFGYHVYVVTALLNIYVDFGLVGVARKVFDEMHERNLVTWNVMLTGLVKWGHLDAALSMFFGMPCKNSVSWTGIIDGSTKMRNYLKAYFMFRKMTSDGGIMPTEVTVLAISQAIADLGDLKNCKVIHSYGYRTCIIVADNRVMNCLIDTYSKCGCIGSALRVFEEIPTNRRDLVSWTSIISGFAMHGMANEATESFDRMENSGFRPNQVTFLGILNAFSHSGLVEEGLQFFRRITEKYQIKPDIKHYGCVIDMLSRAGKLKEAEEIACQIPDHIDNVVIWRTLLGGCSFHGDAEMAEHMTKRMHEMEIEYGGDCVLMSNILRGHVKFSEAENVRTLMDQRSVPKICARSFV